MSCQRLFGYLSYLELIADLNPNVVRLGQYKNLSVFITSHGHSDVSIVVNSGTSNNGYLPNLR